MTLAFLHVLANVPVHYKGVVFGCKASLQFLAFYKPQPGPCVSVLAISEVAIFLTTRWRLRCCISGVGSARELTSACITRLEQHCAVFCKGLCHLYILILYQFVGVLGSFLSVPPYLRGLYIGSQMGCIEGRSCIDHWHAVWLLSSIFLRCM